jgi:molybdate transport system substrate-binding protein
MKPYRTAVISLLTGLLILAHAASASAAEIRVLCSNGLKAVFEELAPQFERASGHKVVVTYGLAAVFKQQIESGTAFDLAVLTPALIDDLIKSGKVAADSRTVIARTGLGVMIKTGARKPSVQRIPLRRHSSMRHPLLMRRKAPVVSRSPR